LEHQGILYEILTDNEFMKQPSRSYLAIIVLGCTHPALSTDVINGYVERERGVLWIGEALPDSFYPFFGIKKAENTEQFASISEIRYDGLGSTLVFNEALCPICSINASVHGVFTNNASEEIAPAEVSFQKNGSGLTYFFAYDVCSWWNADFHQPWLRAYRLYHALETILSNDLLVRLSPYPSGKRAAFICRIEDVDPLHNADAWVSRAENYLTHYTASGAPLTISVIPMYVEPANGFSVELDSEESGALRHWLCDVICKGGAIVQHGYTHQYGEGKTGVASEFFNEESGEWLSINEQKERIAAGARALTASLSYCVKGFEAPHYVANNDTFAALSLLGFKYVTHNTNTPFLDRYLLCDGLVNLPETLGYFPLNFTDMTVSNIKNNMDILHEMGGVMLFFNHLYDDSASYAGKALLAYSQAKEGVWLTQTDNLASFWLERTKAYQEMEVTIGKELEVVLGPTDKEGLTLLVQNGFEIQGVSINGKPWASFDNDSVILPSMKGEKNRIVIYAGSVYNSKCGLGLSLFFFSTIISVILIKPLTKSESTDHEEDLYPSAG
jgi:hypothetical protein